MSHFILRRAAPSGNATSFAIPQPELLLRGTAYLILGIITLIGNCIVLYVFHKHRALLRIPSNIFIINLSISDILNGLLKDCFFAMAYYNNGWSFGEALCRFNGFMQTLCYIVTVFTLLAIGICRYLVIVHSYGKLITSKIIIIIVICIWIYSVLDSLMPVFGWNRYIFQPLEFACLPDYLSVSGASYIWFGLIVDTIIPLAILGLCYVIIFAVIIKNAHKMRKRFHGEYPNNKIPSTANSLDNSLANSTANSVANTPEILSKRGHRRQNQRHNTRSTRDGLARKETKITVAMFLVYIIFLACYLPYAIVMFILVPNGVYISHQLVYLVGYLINLNSALNPLLYPVIYRTFRKAYKELLCRCTFFTAPIKLPTAASRHKHLIVVTPLTNRKNRVDIVRDGVTDFSIGTSNL